MLKQKNDLSKKIAWNGISLQVPQTWVIDSLDTVHLIIGEEGSPGVELKWTDAPRQFTLETYLKKFISQSQRLLGMRIQELPTPGFFSHPAPGFEFFFFSWKSGSSEGNGTLVFCSHCKRLTIIRFFSKARMSIDSLSALILASFADHPEDDQIQWRLFGLDFRAQKSFKLSDYSFKPGYYVVSLKQKKKMLTVFSWGPALFLLSKMSLSEFAAARLPQLRGFATTGVCSRGNYLEWSYRQSRFKNAELLPFLSRYSSFSVFRVVHDQPNNRILGIMIDSPEKFEHTLIKGSMLGDG